MVDFNLVRNAFGRLVFSKGHNELQEEVVPVRAFPLNAPHEGISLMNDKGQELAWFDKLSELPSFLAQLIQDELDSRELMPEIQKILKVSSYTSPCTWYVTTDRGETSFVLQDEGDIRRMSEYALLVTDSHGIYFFIRNSQMLDKQSQHILERFH